MDSPSPHPAPHQHDDHRAGDLWVHRLRLAGVGLPVLFIVATQALRPLLLDRLWPTSGDEIASVLTVLGAAGFGIVMFRLIDRLVEDDRLRATVAERERIARELHDSLAQVLGATSLRLQAASLHPGLPEGVREELDDVAEDCQEAYRDVREAILGLREGPHSEHTLLDGLRTYAQRYSRQCGIVTRVESTLDGEPVLAPTREVQVIRIVQEALTNARKHSGARTARILVERDGEWVRFVVEDDGHGFDPAPGSAHDGFGLHSMRERAQLVGGRLDVDSAPGRGTRVSVTVPHGVRGSRLAAVVSS